MSWILKRNNVDTQLFANDLIRNMQWEPTTNQVPSTE